MKKTTGFQVGKWLLIVMIVGSVIWLSRSVFQVDANSIRNWILSIGF
nr:hypothetical protein [Planococcus antarcticus]